MLGLLANTDSKTDYRDTGVGGEMKERDGGIVGFSKDLNSERLCRYK